MEDASLHRLLKARYGAAPDVPEDGFERLAGMAGRGSCRRFRPDPVPAGWIDCLAAVALASPTKSDLQQRDIVVLHSPDQRARLAQFVGGQDWVADAPMLAVFCGNNRRQRLLHDWHGSAFANDHIDAVINATADAAIAMGAFITAAEAMGMGCCPISAVRNEAAAVSDLLDLPDHVFPFAGLAFGFPADPPPVSMRLPLGVTCHVDKYAEADLRDDVARYDTARAAAQPYDQQRDVARFGEATPYTWSEDKVRQYSQPERAGFGAFLRDKGFRLD